MDKENVIDIPLGGTPFNLLLHTHDWSRDGLADGSIVCSGQIDDLDVSYTLYCNNSVLSNFVHSKKKEFAKSYGYNYWGEIARQRNKHELDSITHTFIKELFK